MKKTLPLALELEHMRRMVPSMRYDGGDFAAWQSEARAKLAELLGMDKFERVSPEVEIEYDKPADGFRDIRFRFMSEPDYSVPCHLCLPLNANKPLPLMICLQGHSRGMYLSIGQTKCDEDIKNLEGDRDYAVRAVKEGYAALAIEQRNFGECGGKEDGPDCYKATMSALLTGRTTAGERAWDVMRAIDAVTEFFGEYTDTSFVGCLGNSGGGSATFYASCLDERIRLSIPSCAVCTYDDSIAPMHHCSCNFIPHIREYFNMGDLGGLIAPRALVMVNGEEDNIFPIDGAKRTFKTISSLYKAAGAPEKCVHVIGGEGHRFYADLTWEAAHGLCY